jgi:5-methylcytosine-specific restriction endonuclease McrA
MPKRPRKLPDCFECGSPASHHHHVIPHSLGGTQTVPLCEGSTGWCTIAAWSGSVS